ncbi:uncharacterized protein LOC118438239 [Folsomia candida]|nr:uncharacterized protein LOC118438239 [Folsomia candida]
MMSTLRSICEAVNPHESRFTQSIKSATEILPILLQWCPNLELVIAAEPMLHEQCAEFKYFQPPKTHGLIKTPKVERMMLNLAPSSRICINFFSKMISACKGLIWLGTRGDSESLQILWRRILASSATGEWTKVESIWFQWDVFQKLDMNLLRKSFPNLNRFDIDINLKTNDGTTRAEGIPKMNTILHISTLQLTFSETKKISIESLRKSICTMCSTFPNLTLFVIVANVLPNKVRLVSRDTDRYSGKAGGTDEELNKETLDEDEHFALVVFKLVQPYEHILFRFLNFQFQMKPEIKTLMTTHDIKNVAFQ